MKRILTTLSLALLTLGALAIPAKKGIWQTLPLNGTMVKAQLMGDEHMRYWQTEDGRQLSEIDGTFALADMTQLRRMAEARHKKAASSRQRRIRHNAIGDFMHYSGKKKGLIILVEFSDTHFLPANDSLLYTRICNEEGFSQGRFRGSVYDYFKAQSYGEFELTFDVMGPVQMPNGFKYYGEDSGPDDFDIRPGEMVAAACQAVDSLVDFHDYDWDGDGVVDQVMCIYAGYGQADGGASATIWPHEWELSESDYGQVLELDEVKIDTYAVANERSYSGIEGIGTICHEFSHCLGLPDMYDVQYGGNFGMGNWSLMDSGSYNGDSFCPAGFSSFDKLTCGWVIPMTLDHNQTVEAMQPLEDAPEVYIIRNNNWEDEYYLLENRQQKGWDAELPGNGLLILHVDYDRTIWENNLVNTKSAGTDGLPVNDHQRCTIFHASNVSSGYGYHGSRDPYPYLDKDSLTNTSLPAAKLYNVNKEGHKQMDKGILDITRNQDGTMSFRFRNTATEEYIPSGTLLRETFSNCNGTGGNDNVWSTSIASSIFSPDLEGWDVVKAYGGWQCARFGNASTAGEATTPAFETETGEALLSFKAAGWNNDGVDLTLSIEGEGRVKPSVVTMDPFAWNEYSVRVYGKGPLRVTFAPEKRFLLDSVIVVQIEADSTDAVRQLPSSIEMQEGYYTLDGRYVGSSQKQLPRGLYILYTNEDRKGRKIVK